MAAHIALHYTEKLRVEDIAKAAGLNPNYAMNLFSRTCGMSLLDYVIQHRLFHSRRLLATTDAKVIEIALESGFGSLSRFYEAFQRAYGRSPQAYRRRFA